MSLLGIIIDKTKAKERLDSPKGFVAGGTDEQLLKEIGGIVLEKGVWTPKYKGGEVAEFLNWIAEGKPKGHLPLLAKRLLCLKREKLARGIKDAGTADYARTFEKQWIAEIDAIFSEAGERVECVVDFVKAKAEYPPASVPPASVPPASVVPRQPATPTAPNNDDNNEDSGSDTNTAKAQKSPYDKLLEDLKEKYESVDTATKPRLERILGALITKRNAANISEIVDAINSIMAKEITINEKINEINSVLGIIEKSVNADETLMAVEKLVNDATVAKKTFYPEIKHLVQELIYTTCGTASLLDPLVDHLHNLIATFETIKPDNSRFSTIQATLIELRRMLTEEALKMENTQKNGALQDKLEKLKDDLATLKDSSSSSDRLASIRTQIRSLEALIESSESIEAQKMIKRDELTREKDLLVQLIGILGDKYDDFKRQATEYLVNIDAELKVLSAASPNIKSIATECNRRAFEYRKFIEILKNRENEEHKGVIADLETKHADELRKQAEEKDAIINRLQTQLDTDIPAKDNRINALTEELAAATARIERLESSNTEKESRAREASVAKNALNEELVRARAQIAALEEALRQAEEISRNIKERNDKIAAFERNYETVVSSGIEKNRLLKEERTSHSAERNQLTQQLTEERAGRTKNIASRDARITELEGELATSTGLRNQIGVIGAERNELTTRLKAAEEALAAQRAVANEASAAASRDVSRLTNELAAARHEGVNIDSLTAELQTARARHDSNTSRISELQTQVERIGDLERDLSAAQASVAYRNGNVAERNARIKDLEATLAAEKAGRTGNAAERNARIASLQNERNTAIATVDTERQACKDTVSSLASQVENKDRRIGELEAAAAVRPRTTTSGHSDAARLRGYGVGRDWAAAHTSALAPSGLDRAARAETEHISRIRDTAGSRTGSRTSRHGGGTLKQKQKTARHTRKLKK